MTFINNFIDEDSAIQIYKLARKHIIRDIPEAYYRFHARRYVRHFGAHRVIRFRSFRRFHKEITWMMAIANENVQISSKHYYFIQQMAVVYARNKHFLTNRLHGNNFRRAIIDFKRKMACYRVTWHIAVQLSNILRSSSHPVNDWIE